MTNKIPTAALDQHVAILGKTGSGPAFRSDPRKILCQRACAQCGAEFAVAKKYPGQRFCSRRCGLSATLPADHNARNARATAERRGDVQRGRGHGKGYRKLNGRHEHRVIAEQALGRALKPGEVVHHRDENRQHNDPDNLQALPSQAEHAREHFKGRKQTPEHVRKRVESTKRTKRGKSNG